MTRSIHEILLDAKFHIYWFISLVIILQLTCTTERKVRWATDTYLLRIFSWFLGCSIDFSCVKFLDYHFLHSYQHSELKIKLTCFRCMQEVQLDQKIKLLDSPGVVLASGGDTHDVLKNATKVEQLSDPIAAATTILMRATKQQVK